MAMNLVEEATIYFKRNQGFNREKSGHIRHGSLKWTGNYQKNL